MSKAGIQVWFDKKSLLPGQKWRNVIKTAIKNSRYFLAILSSNSVTQKGYVQKEVSEALDLLDEFPESEIFIIPIRLDECEPSHEKLKDLHWANLFSDWDDGLIKILASMGIEPSNNENRIILKPIFFEDIKEQFQNTELNLLNLNKYLKLTKQDVMWTEITNRIIEQLIESCVPPSLTVVFCIDRINWGTGSDLLTISKTLGITDIIELDSIFQEAANFGEFVISSVYATWLEQLMRNTGGGTADYGFSFYQNIATLILYAKIDILKAYPSILEKLPLHFYTKDGIIKIIQDQT